MRALCVALLLSGGCRSGGTSLSAGRPPVPAVPNLPGDTILTAALPGVPRSEVLYYRTLVGVIFDDTTSGTRIRSILARYHGTIVGGVPGPDEYIVRIPDPGATLAALDSVVSKLHDEAGVRLARKVYRRWQPTIDASDYVIAGRVMDTQQHVPVRAAIVTVPPADETQSDSTGVFRLRVAARAGCYPLRVRRIGYGATVRTIALARDSLVALGDISLRPSVVPESRLLLVLGCNPPDSVPVLGEWGTDTVKTSREP